MGWRFLWCHPKLLELDTMKPLVDAAVVGLELGWVAQPKLLQQPPEWLLVRVKLRPATDRTPLTKLTLPTMPRTGLLR